MTMQHEVREASTSDHEQVAALLRALGYVVPAELVAERLGLFAAAANRRVLVAEEGGRLLGLLSMSWQEWLSHERPVARVTELVVAPDGRRRGVGRRLIERASALAEGRGCELIELTTALSRAEAHSFYDALGFERTSYRYARALPARRDAAGG
jgi:ribosomal protein S18 acetylase RimI-like enzyme